MASKYIGVIYAKESKEIRAIFNPAYDWQLKDFSHTICEEEKREMLKLPRKGLPLVMTPNHIPEIIETVKEILNK